MQDDKDEAGSEGAEKANVKKDAFLIGKAGGEYIRSALSTKQPRQVFEEIQHQYGLVLPEDDTCLHCPFALFLAFSLQH